MRKVTRGKLQKKKTCLTETCLLMEGVIVSLRFCFALKRLNERYGDLSPTKRTIKARVQNKSS
jgi:hypothetical protein